MEYAAKEKQASFDLGGGALSKGFGRWVWAVVAVAVAAIGDSAEEIESFFFLQWQLPVGLKGDSRLISGNRKKKRLRKKYVRVIDGGERGSSHGSLFLR